MSRFISAGPMARNARALAALRDSLSAKAMFATTALSRTSSGVA